MVNNNAVPNFESTIIDKSLGSVQTLLGSVGFILPAQWGAVYKVMNVTGTKGGVSSLYEMYGKAIFNTNHITWATIANFLDYRLTTVKVCRVAKDDYTTVNAVKFIGADMTRKDWNHGTDQYRKLNEEDDSYPSILITKLKLTADPAGGSAAIGDLVTGVTSGAKGYIDAIILNADTTEAKAYIYLKTVVDGTTAFSAGEVVGNGTWTATVDTAGATEIELNDVYFHESRLTMTAGHEDKVPIGATIVKGSATAIVVGRDRTSHYLYLSEVTGTWSSGDLTSVNSIVAEAGKITSTTVTATDAIKDVLMFFAKYPGTVGNTISVAMCNRADFSTAAYSGSNKFSSLFEVTSLSTDEVAIVVLLNGTVVEQWICSLDQTATLQGGKSYFIDSFLEDNSAYIGSISVVSGTKTIADLDDLTVGTGYFAAVALAGGAAGTVGLVEAKLGYDQLLLKRSGVRFLGDFHELSDMSAYGTLITYIIAACTANKRCALVHTMTKDSVSVVRTADQCITLSGISGVNSYYSIPVYEWKWYVDGDLKKKYYIPCTADVLACIVNTISNYGDWVAPFGVVKGILQNTTKLYYNLEEGDGSLMSDLYKRGINPIVYREDENGNAGFFFYGNRTKYNPASDLSRINIANALLADIKKLGQLAEPFISESIDQNTFDLIVQRCDKNYLATRAVKAFDQLDGDDGYSFICDSSNNTAQTRKEKSIIMDFMVKYKSAAEYLKLRITVTSAGTDFALI